MKTKIGKGSFCQESAKYRYFLEQGPVFELFLGGFWAVLLSPTLGTCGENSPLWAVFALFLPIFLPMLAGMMDRKRTHSGPIADRMKMEEARKIYEYKPAKVVDGHVLYVEFWAWNVSTNQLQRKRIQKFTGKNHRERLTDAKRQAREITGLLKRGFVLGKVEEPHQYPTTILEAIKRACHIKQLEGGRRMPQHISTFRKRFEKWLTSVRLFNLNAAEFERHHALKFLDWLIETYDIKNRTRNNYRDDMRAIFAVMLDRGWVKSNPAAGIRDLRTHGQKNKPYSPEQKEILDTYLKKNAWELFVFTRLIYYGFLRPVEIMRLRINHIDMKNRVILVYSDLSKNSKQMPVVITHDLEPILKEYLDKHRAAPESYYLFAKGFVPGPVGWARNRFSEAYRKVLEETGLYDGELTGYSWKHTGVRNAFLAGVDILDIKDQCRHHSLEQTETYLRSMGLRISSNLKNATW